MIQHIATIDIDISEYGNMIREKRIRLGFTEKKLAEICDRSDREIRNIESGNSVPKLDTVLKIAYALDWVSKNLVY